MIGHNVKRFIELKQKKALSEYETLLAEEIKLFFKDCVKVVQGKRVKSSELYDCFVAWYFDNYDHRLEYVTHKRFVIVLLRWFSVSHRHFRDGNYFIDLDFSFQM